MDFDTAAAKVKDLKVRPTDNELLELYGFFKQGTVGDCNTEKPGMFNLKDRAKWEAWNDHKGMSKEEAQKKYIAIVQTLLTKYKA